MVADNKNIDVVILCGGLGTRFRNALKDRPKPMAEIRKKPFLDILIEYAASFGFKRFILCAGYKAEVIKEYYKKKRREEEILMSVEASQLGTGGAVKNAESLIRTNPFFVMNGDSFCPVDLNEFADFHGRKKAFISIVLVHKSSTGDYGAVRIERSGRIVRFDEKIKQNEKSLINAGIYLFDSSVLPLMPGEKAFSLEYDFFPKAVDKETYGYVTEERFLDIGTPERLKEAKKVLEGKKGGKKGDRLLFSGKISMKK